MEGKESAGVCSGPGAGEHGDRLKGTQGDWYKAVWRGRQKISDSPEKPSKTILHLAQVEGLDCLKNPYWRDCMPKPASRAAWNDGLIERVWQESCLLLRNPD